MKKILGLIIAIAVAVQGIALSTASAEENILTYDIQAETLINLGIIKDYDIDTYDPYSYIPNREFLSMINNLTDGGEITDYDSYAKQIGAIKSNEKLQNFKYVTSDFALSAAMGALGYNRVADSVGTNRNTWLLQQGRRLGLTGGLPLNENMSLRRSQAVKLVFNMLDAEVMDYNSTTVDSEGYATTDYKTLDDEALYFFRKIYHSEGIVDGTEFTEMYDDSSMRRGSISVDGKVYEVNKDVDFGKYVGVLCDIYIEEKTNTVLSATPKSTVKKLEITADELENYDDVQRIISYVPENANNARWAHIEKTAAVISNGAGLKTYGKSDIEISNGKIILYDNDDNGKYDVIRIESAKIFLTESVNYSKRTLYNKLAYDANALSITADENDDNNKVIIIKDGKEITMSDIIENDVLEVYYNPGASRRIIKIIATSNSFEAAVDKVDSDFEKLTANGKEYEFWKSYKSGAAADDRYTPEIKAGQTYTFYLSSNGYIVAAEADKYNGMTAGYLYKTSHNSKGIDDEYGIRIFTDKEKWENIPLADRIKLNNASQKTSACFSDIEAKKGSIILIKKDSKGEVSEIKTATDKFVLGETSDNFTYSEMDSSTDSALVFRNVSNYFEGNSSKNIAFFIGNGTKIFAAPAEGSGSENDFGLTNVSTLKNDNSYTSVKAYGVDKFGIADYVVVELDDNMRKDKVRSGTAMLVSEAYETMNEDGETVQAIVGPYEFLSRYTVTFDSDAQEYDKEGNLMTTKTKIEPGDLIRFSRNEKGVVNSYSVLCRASYAEKGEGYYPYGEDRRMHGVSAAFMYGAFVAADSQKGVIMLDVKASPTDAQDLKATVTKSSVKVFICEKNSRSTTVRMGSLKDLTKGDFVYAQAEWAVIHTIVVYK